MRLFNWGKKKNEPLNSEEFEQLSKRLVAVVGDIDIMSNRISVVSSIAKGNRAKIGKILREEIVKESENDLKDDTHYM